MSYNTDPLSVCPDLSLYLPSPKAINETTTTIDDLRRKEEEDVSPAGQTPITCPAQVANAGYDTFHISLDLHGFTHDFFEDLKTKKLNLQSSDTQEAVFEFLDNGSKCFQWNLQRTGIKLYPYVFRTGDLILGLSVRQPGSSIPNACLKIGSLSCHQDVAKLFKDFKWWLCNIGVTVLDHKVSRADICSDIKVDIKKQHLDKITRFITRARDSDVRYSSRKLSGVNFGSGDIMCRIYDKPLEMNQKSAAEKIMFFNDLWGTNLGESVTRVEFQLRRKSIVQFFKGKTTLDVFLNRAGDLWQYLTKEWLRHCDRYVDRDHKHQSRSTLSSFWSIVQQAFALKKKKLTRKRDQKHINIPALRKQAIGIYTTILAGLGHVAEDFFDVIRTASDILAEDLNTVMREPGFDKAYRVKINRAVVSF
jgi:hypothetical protein